MQALAELIRRTLPLNRKERYYTGTVFPMIVCKDGFKYFNRLLPLVGLGDLDTSGITWSGENLVFYTEYSLNESITDKDEGRFKDRPRSNDTPDIVIYIDTPEPVIIAFEAKMYVNQSAAELSGQMDAQKEFLGSMCDALDARYVHFALIPAMMREKFGSAFTDPVLTWEDLHAAYADTGEDYFLDMLRLALDWYPELVSKPFGRRNAVRMATGTKVKRDYEEGTLRDWYIGRAGGVTGRVVEDVRTGGWKTWTYELSDKDPGNSNWFPVSAFILMIETGER